MNVADGVLIGLVLALGLRLIWSAARTGRPSFPWPFAAANPDPGEAHGMQSALHAATATLPHLRRGLDVGSATEALPHLRALTGAAAIALADTDTVLAIDGEGREQVRPGDMLTRLLARTRDDRVRVVPRLVSSDPSCPLNAAALAPLVVGGRRAGTLIAFYRAVGRPSEDELRVVAEAASLVCAQVELSVLAEQERRLAQAELRALRAEISPHFLYNALAAVAANIHEDPEAAREQLIDFAEFTRYLFRDGRSYVSLAEEVEHVTRYLRLEQARFPGTLEVRVEVEPEARGAIVPTMSLQPLVENAIRHGVRRPGGGTITIRAVATGDHVELSVTDDGAGFTVGSGDLPRSAAGGGIGLANVDARLRSTFGELYRLRIESAPGLGTTVAMTVPASSASTLRVAA
ncbi:MAG TPA: histidine kinase [Solirubrobacteraceae bacterium]|jgi:two-component system LytT family sensor kinase